ncbi:MAG: alpha/beta hydrolase, partial [Pseudomonadales bacterium]|nr:alpha/beta hydrolase [Pseudomonadales bacterium]
STSRRQRQMCIRDRVYGDTNKLTDAKSQLYFDMTLREGNRGANNYRLSQPSDFSLLPKLSELNIPTLILWGEKDAWILPKYANLLKEKIPNSSVIMYPDLGHIPMEEAPKRTANDVIAFIGKNQ